MNKKNLVVFALLIMAFAGCKKDTDNASKWVGTYAAVSGAGVNYNTYINQVVIQEGNGFTLHLALNNTGNGGVTYVTLQKVTLQSATSGTISESDSTLGIHSMAQYSGSVALLSGDTLKMLCSGVDTVNSVTVSYNFYGVKQ